MTILRIANLALLATATTQLSEAQVCRLSVAGLNRNRAVMGPVHAECPLTLHSTPFGNWGVTSNFGQKIDGHQFNGWCQNTQACDNNGNCAVHCRDGWYEWNSCTDIPQFSPPNATLYNAMNGTQQVTTTGINVHGTRIFDVRVPCPVDSNSDGLADSGGCTGVRTHSSGVNFMSLYELDPGTTDDLIQTVYFPELVVPTGCRTWNCPPAISDWVAPNGYDSPSTPAKVYAEISMLVNSGTFIDTGRVCRSGSFRADTVSGASFAPGPVAPESIASVFGQGLATGTDSADSLPLPTVLARSTVSVADSAGVSRQSPMFYASPDQMNIQIPAGTAAGNAAVVVTREDGITVRSSVAIAPVAPGIFTANANGSGVAAGYAIRVGADGTQTTLPIYQCGVQPLSCVPVPISLGAATDQVILVLFGTGIRFHSAAAPLRVQVGGTAAEVLYAGAQGQFVGLDQINVRLSRALRGDVTILVSAGNLRANPVMVRIQ